MIPIKLTQNHYVNPQAVAHVCCNPKTAGDAPAMFIFFTGEDEFPLELYGVEAEEAIANWRNFYSRDAQQPQAA